MCTAELRPEVAIDIPVNVSVTWTGPDGNHILTSDTSRSGINNNTYMSHIIVMTEVGYTENLGTYTCEVRVEATPTGASSRRYVNETYQASIMLTTGRLCYNWLCSEKYYTHAYIQSS